MRRIVITGGGVIGLTTAMLLARDGHDVTVLERDAAAPPDPTEAWEAWDRQGVNQWRLLHFFLPRFRSIAESELPDLVKAFDAAGALRFNPLAGMPDEISGGWRPDDTRFESITGRRPVMESVIAATASTTPGVTIRRGVPVTGLLIDDRGAVTGVRTEQGEEIGADVVVDAGGRRSALPRWLADVGASSPVEELDDCGFVYYGRHFRGNLPPAIAPLLQEYGSVSVLTLPADNGTWGVGLITSSQDAALRPAKEPDVWESILRQLPFAAHWLDGEPLEERPLIIAKIEDRHRDFVVDGRPVAPGVLPVGDSWACTNPSVGRGISIGAIHAVALRDFLREDVSDRVELSLGWHDVTMRTVEPYFRSTLSFDRHRLAEMEALIEGREPPTDDEWEITKALAYAGGSDPDCLRAFIDVASALATPEDVLGPVLDKVIEHGAGWRDAPDVGPSRADLVAMASRS